MRWPHASRRRRRSAARPGWSSSASRCPGSLETKRERTTKKLATPAPPGSPRMTDLARMAASALAGMLEAGETPSVDLTMAHLDRIAAVDGAVHAFLQVDNEGALAAARASDARRAA